MTFNKDTEPTKRTPSRRLKTSATVHLQQVGLHSAVAAEQLIPGNILCWNGGGTTEVISIKNLSPCYIEIMEKWTDYDRTIRVTPRRLKKGRLVALSTLHPLRNTQISTGAAGANDQRKEGSAAPNSATFRARRRSV